MPYKNKENEKTFGKKYYIKNRKKILKYQKKYRKNNPQKILEYARQYRITHKKEMRELCKKYYENNRVKLIKNMKQYYKNNPEKGKERRKEWVKNNREKIREYSKLNTRRYRENDRDKMNQKQRDRHKTDLKFDLTRGISCLIRQSLKGNKNGKHWETLVGYTLDDLIRRLKKTMPEGYIWNDYLQGRLHIDHIVPISAHNYTKSKHPDFKRCWALSNLQLLPAKENLIKSDHLTRPFQPALKLN